MTGAPATSAARGGGRGFAVLCAAQFLLVLDVAVVNVALASVQRDLGFAGSDLQLVVTAYTLGFGCLLLLSGRIADAWGRRRVFLAGLTVFSSASVLCGLAPTATSLVLARGVQGIGAALVAPAALALVAVLFPQPSARARALGVWSALAAAGGAAGLLLGGVLTDLVGWRAVFLVNVVGFVLVLLGSRRLPPSPPSAVSSLDLPGAVLVVLGLVSVVRGVTLAARRDVSPAPVAALIGVGVAALVAFAVRERLAREPLVPGRLLAESGVVAANVATVLMSPVVVGVNVLITLYLQQALDFSPLHTGLAFLPLTVVSTGAALVAGRLSDRWGARVVLTGSLLLIALGAVVLRQTADGGGYLATVLPGLVLVGAGLGPAFAVASLAATASVADERQGAASGLLSTAQQIGGSLGLALLVLLATRGPGRLTAGTPGAPTDDPTSVLLGLGTAVDAMVLLSVTAAAVAAVGLRPHVPAAGSARLVRLPVPAVVGSPTAACLPAATVQPAVPVGAPPAGAISTSARRRAPHASAQRPAGGPRRRRPDRRSPHAHPPVRDLRAGDGPAGPA